MILISEKVVRGRLLLTLMIRIIVVDKLDLQRSLKGSLFEQINRLQPKHLVYRKLSEEHRFT